MYAERHSVTLTTDASGDVTGYLPEAGTLTGEVRGLFYIKTDYADGIDFVATGEATGEPILTDTDVNATQYGNPRQAAMKAEDGADLANIRLPALLANDRIKIVVSSGGDTKSGTFTVVLAGTYNGP